ncbi:hypothetical protein [Mycolicibacterium phlei]|uniref:hypothetical protein n=1 Tax=Mycolicibacterium phlei TaxID=1771 RepID=UPI0002F72843|nr:hypothetical protein [Mycolicibacterium phlei]MBF4194570.1 hypothetical protein [Mycolicibacterium phlei]
MSETATAPAKAWIGRNGYPVYATAEDFKTVWDENTTFPFFEDEYASGVYGFGHQDKEAFAASVNEYDQLCGCDVAPEDKYTAADVIHAWAVLLDPRNSDGMRFSWRGVDSMTLGSWPLTWIPR